MGEKSDGYHFAAGATFFFLGVFFFGVTAFFPAVVFLAAAFFVTGFFFAGDAFFAGDPATGLLGAAAAAPLTPDSGSSFTGDRVVTGFLGLAGLLPFDAAAGFFGFAAAFFPVAAFFLAGDFLGLSVFFAAAFDLAGLLAFGPFAVFFAAFFTGLFFGDLAGDGLDSGAGVSAGLAVGAGRLTPAFDLAAGAFFGDALRARAGLLAAFPFFSTFAPLAFVTVTGWQSVRQVVRGGEWDAGHRLGHG